MALQLYLDLNSQPCRSVYIFAKKNNIAFEFKPVSLAEGQQYTEEFEKVNLLKRVPALKDGDFTMAESVAILKYLAGKYKTPDHWYPANLQQRARVDEYLAWQHTTIRFHGSRLYMFKSCPQLKLEPLWDRLRAPYVWPRSESTSASTPFWIIMVMMGLLPLLSGEPIPTDKMDEAMSDLQTSIRLFEDKFLRDRPFIAGREVSLADLVAIVELMQPLGVGFDPFKDRPKLCSWRDRVEAALGKELFDEAHEKMMKRSGSLSNLDVNSPALQRFAIGLKKTYMSWRLSPSGCKSTC